VSWIQGKRERERERKGKMRLAHELWFGKEQWVGLKVSWIQVRSVNNTTIKHIFGDLLCLKNIYIFH
jgi:hypothetical protein